MDRQEDVPAVECKGCHVSVCRDFPLESNAITHELLSEKLADFEDVTSAVS